MSDYVYYTAYYQGKLIGKYKMNMAYNTLLELAELVGKKIYEKDKPRRYEYDLVDVQQGLTYRYLVDLQYFTFLEYGDYRIGHDKDRNNCNTYHPNSILPVLVKTVYPSVNKPVAYWGGDKIPGLQRDDVFNMLHGKIY